MQGLLVKLILPWLINALLNWIAGKLTEQRVVVADPKALPRHPAPQTMIKPKPAGPHTRVPKYEGIPGFDRETGTWK